MTEQNLNLVDEVKRRRTFAIISHPDAGKTTLTEKFLLYGGAIREAGSVNLENLKNMQYLTGWKLKNKEVYLLHQVFFNLNIITFV